jgi:hypothetical protein
MFLRCHYDQHSAKRLFIQILQRSFSPPTDLMLFTNRSRSTLGRLPSLKLWLRSTALTLYDRVFSRFVRFRF